MNYENDKQEIVVKYAFSYLHIYMHLFVMHADNKLFALKTYMI